MSTSATTTKSKPKVMQENNPSILPGSQGGARVFKSWRLPKPCGKCHAEIHLKAKTTTPNSWAPTESQSTYDEIPSPTTFSCLRELAKGERQWDSRWAPTHSEAWQSGREESENHTPKRQGTHAALCWTEHKRCRDTDWDEQLHRSKSSK